MEPRTTEHVSREEFQEVRDTGMATQKTLDGLVPVVDRLAKSMDFIAGKVTDQAISSAPKGLSSSTLAAIIVAAVTVLAFVYQHTDKN
tara:strand:+ start:88 stop:351 length:264 start_codon:yes stop_codon:yes gene_type:complete